MFLLDTNVVSELPKPRPDGRVIEWFDSIDESSAYLSAATDFELEIGVLRMERRDPAQGAVRRKWLLGVRAFFGTRILPATPEILRECARLHVPDPRPLWDSIIAATALHHGFIVVTRNTSDFDIPGLAVLNPFEAPA